jgi:hypothetical protein
MLAMLNINELATSYGSRGPGIRRMRWNSNRRLLGDISHVRQGQEELAPWRQRRLFPG